MLEVDRVGLDLGGDVEQHLGEAVRRGVSVTCCARRTRTLRRMWPARFRLRELCAFCAFCAGLGRDGVIAIVGHRGALLSQSGFTA